MCAIVHARLLLACCCCLPLLLVRCCSLPRFSELHASDAKKRSWGEGWSSATRHAHDWALRRRRLRHGAAAADGSRKKRGLRGQATRSAAHLNAIHVRNAASWRAAVAAVLGDGHGCSGWVGKVAAAVLLHQLLATIAHTPSCYDSLLLHIGLKSRDFIIFILEDLKQNSKRGCGGGGGGRSNAYGRSAAPSQAQSLIFQHH